MKKFLLALAASAIIFGGQAEAAPADDLNVNAQIETQDMKSSGKWAHFRDKYILGRETENERRDRKERERRHRYEPPPPPPYYHRDGKHYYPPPPPPNHRDGRPHYPPPPPPRHR